MEEYADLISKVEKMQELIDGMYRESERLDTLLQEEIDNLRRENLQLKKDVAELEEKLNRGKE